MISKLQKLYVELRKISNEPWYFSHLEMWNYRFVKRILIQFINQNPMKMKNKIFAVAILAMGFSAKSFAQSSDVATATATLVTPISISKTVDMNFGTVASSATAGSVVLGTDNVATPAGGVSIPGGSPTAAKFTVSGEGTSSFTISLPTSIILAAGANNLTVNNFTSNPSGTGALVAGTADVAVGATLVVPANTPAGVYTNSTDLTVTVNYN